MFDHIEFVFSFNFSLVPLVCVHPMKKIKNKMWCFKGTVGTMEFNGVLIISFSKDWVQGIFWVRKKRVNDKSITEYSHKYPSLWP